MSEALKPEDTGLGLTSADVGFAGAIYVAGACLGALFFGQLTGRFGRKKLFMLTLGVYTVATVQTAFSPNPTWYFIARFLTGAGICGEYAAINSAIDELIPARYRGRVDVAINGSFWVGAAGGAVDNPVARPDRAGSSARLATGGRAVLGVCPVRTRVGTSASRRFDRPNCRRAPVRGVTGSPSCPVLCSSPAAAGESVRLPRCSWQSAVTTCV